MKIYQKLIVLVAIPLLAFAGLGIVYVKANIDESNVIENMSSNLKLLLATSDLIHELQKERGRTSIYLSGGSLGDMEEQRKRSDSKIEPVIEALTHSTIPQQAKDNTTRAISGIKEIRSRADRNSPAGEVVGAYNALIAAFLETESSVGNSKTTRGFGKALTTMIILEIAKENTGQLRAVVSGILTSDKPVSDEIFTRLITLKANIDTNLDSKAIVLSPEAKSKLDTSRQSSEWNRVNEELNVVLTKHKEGDFGIAGTDFFATITKVIDDMYDVRNKEIESINANLAGIQESISSTLIRVYVSISLTLLIVVIVAFFLARSITTPIQHLISYAKDVAAGNFDARLTDNFSQELESLRASLGIMVDNLKAKIQEAEDNSAKAAEQTMKATEAMRASEIAQKRAETAKAEGMLDAAGHIEDVAVVLTSASEQLSMQIDNSTHGAETQAVRIAETATAMEEMNATVMEVAKNAAEAADTADQARHKAREGADVVTQVVSGIGEVQAASLELKNDMMALGKQAEEIGQILNVISDIADQTNLLALNAAIEAARAGESGRGFAVVADEVRKLAEKTMDATKEVDRAISAIQEGAKKNIANVEFAVSRIDTATSLANSSGDALNEIVNLVNLTTDQVSSIATAAEEQSATSEEINRSIDDVNRISSETSDAMRQSADAVNELTQQVYVLKNLIEQMKAEGGKTPENNL